MSNKLKFVLFAWLQAFFVAAQSYTPFPYPIEKVVEVDSAAVVTAHPLATQVGLDILRKGGNAIDAAVAVQFALAVVYPQAGNIGGGGFLIYRNAKGETAALDYREKAPETAHERMFQDTFGEVLTNKSRYGVFAAGVPGTVDGMWAAHQKYGSMPWGRLVQPAVELAEKGFQITAREAANLEKEKMTFARFNTMLPAFVRLDRPWEAGDWLIQKELAFALRKIADNGRDGFYSGPVATYILKTMERSGGLISAADLENYRSMWRPPLEFDWKGLRIATMPPPSSGGIILQQVLGMVETCQLAKSDFRTAKALHCICEAERRAFADRAQHVADPDFWPVPTEAMTHPDYLSARMRDFNPERATPSQSVKAGVFPQSEETTHYSIVDRKGNAVAVTTTLNDAYGSRVVVSGAGFILNNEMDDFSAKPGAPNLYGAIGGKANAVAPGKRPLSSMTPAIVSRDGAFEIALGTPGGTTIPTSVIQVLLNVYLFGLTLPDAVQTGRFHHQWLPDAIQVEEGAFSDELLQKLEQMGHEIMPRSPIGRVEAIRRLPNGKLQGAADTRGEDAAAGY